MVALIVRGMSAVVEEEVNSPAISTFLSSKPYVKEAK